MGVCTLTYEMMKAFGCHQHQRLLNYRYSPAKHLPVPSEGCSDKKRKRQANTAIPNSFRRRCDAHRHAQQICKAAPEEVDVTAAESGRGIKRSQETSLERNVPVSGMRPWSFLIPTMEEVATDKNWHLKVS